MKPVRIDFAPASVRRSVSATGPAGWLLAGAGLALCVSAAVALVALHGEQVRNDARERRVAGAPAPVRVAQVSVAVPPAQANAVNGALLQLNLPWRDLAEAIEAATPPNVALLALDPEPKTRTLRIQAETKNSADMLAYVEQLKAQEFFVGAALIKHDINEQDTNMPLRFTLEVRWSASAAAP